MGSITIGGIPLEVKDYHCADCQDLYTSPASEEYIPKTEMKLWLYVNITDRCNAGCPFCVSDSNAHNSAVVDPDRFEKVLERCGEFVDGVSLTGGEPMLYPQTVERIIEIIDRRLGSKTQIDLVTNGTDLDALAGLSCFERITTIHISRHHYDDAVNRSLMGGADLPSGEQLKRFLGSIRNPGRVVFNCVMQKNGISSGEQISRFLDFAIFLGVSNTSFITMIKANDYCKEGFVSPPSLPFAAAAECERWNRLHPDSSFCIWNCQRDHSFCSCLNGSYRNTAGATRFYLRCPGSEAAPDYCRQLVFTAENTLCDGFGKQSRMIFAAE